MSSALDRLKNLTNKISSYELARKTNLSKLETLYEEIHIDDKVKKFEDAPQHLGGFGAKIVTL